MNWVEFRFSLGKAKLFWCAQMSIETTACIDLAGVIEAPLDHLGIDSAVFGFFGNGRVAIVSCYAEGEVQTVFATNSVIWVCGIEMVHSNALCNDCFQFEGQPLHLERAIAQEDRTEHEGEEDAEPCSVSFVSARELESEALPELVPAED